MKKALSVIASLIIGSVLMYRYYPDVSGWYKLKKLGHI